MKVISFHESDNKEHWISEIERSDWRAGPFLSELLSKGTFFETVGEGSRVLLLTEGDELISYCTYAEKDDIQPTELTPWIGFVYTFPKHRGHRYAGLLFEEIERLARAEGVSQIYISTNHTGLYEKYGCEYFTELIDIDGNPSRIYVKKIENDRIKRTEVFLKQKLDSGRYMNEHPADKAYRLEHSYRVANIGRRIALEEGFNVEEMVIACLLHDVSYCEDFGEDGWKEHGRRAARIARPFLKELGLPEDRINDICYGIAIHVDDEADFDGERTAFALTVGDADNIDRFDAYRIHEILCCDGFIEKSFEEKQEYVEKRLMRLNQLKDMPMDTKTAEKMWKERLDFYIIFFGKLADQLKCSKEIID